MKEKNIINLIIIFIIFMHFEGFLKLLSNYHPIVHGFKYVFALAFFLIWVFKIGVPKTKLNLPVLAFSSLVLLQFINPLTWGAWFLSATGMLYYIAFVPLFFIANKAIDSNSLKKILYWILGLAGFSALFAHMQHFLGWQTYLRIMPYTQEMITRTWDFVLHGPIAFDVKPPRYWYAAGILISGMFLLQKNKNKWIFGLLGFNCLIALLLSGMRFAIVATFISLIMIFFLNFNSIKKEFGAKTVPRALGIFFLIFIVSFSMLGQNNKSRYLKLINPVEEYTIHRGYTLTGIPSNIIKYPLGAGLRAGGYLNPADYGAAEIRNASGDNYLTTMSGELGILGLIFYFWIYLAITKRFYRNYKKIKGNVNIINTIVFVLLFSFIFEVGFLPGEGPSYWMFWLFAGVLFKLERMEEQEPVTERVEAKVLEKSPSPILNSSIFFNKISPLLKEKERHFNWFEGSRLFKAVHNIVPYFNNSRIFRFIRGKL